MRRETEAAGFARRHRDVQDQQVESLCLDLVQGVEGVRADVDDEAGARQMGLRRAGKGEVVFHDHDAPRADGLRARVPGGRQALGPRALNETA